MQNMSQDRVLKALAATGQRLAEVGVTQPVQVIVCGAVAGILNGDLSGERQTLDCDVIASEPQDQFSSVADAAAAIAETLGLKPQWLNQDASMYAHLLPLGWKHRLHRIDRFGPLEVKTVSRRDLLALKLMGVVKRPHDLEDIEEMQPTAAELNFMSEHLDRLEAESLAGQTYDFQRTVIDDLRRSP